MNRYLLQRLVQLVPVLIGVSLVAFCILRLAPGDPVALMLPGDATQEQIQDLRRRLGLDQPLPVQYLSWLGSALQGNLGTSLFTSRPVMVEILERFPNTAILTAAALLIALLGGMALGILAAVKHGSKFDSTAMVVSVAGWSMPPFWIGLILIIFFGVQLKWLPTSGMYEASSLENSLSDLARHLVLPAFTLGVRHMAYVARLTRSSLLEVLGEDYIRTARAKGLREWVVLNRHALRNALIPVLTVAGVSVGHLLGGAVIVEAVFAWPGVGSLMLKGILARDFPLVQGGLVFVASVFVLVNLLVDMLYAVIDPRIRYA